MPCSLSAPAPVQGSRHTQKPLMNRRRFLQTIAPLTVLGGAYWTTALASEKIPWPIGCFNRAWTNWSYDDALDGIAAAGYKLTGLLSTHKGEAFTR